MEADAAALEAGHAAEGEVTRIIATNRNERQRTTTKGKEPQ
jgi:hypothetical protein